VNFHCLNTSLTRCLRCAMNELGTLNSEGMNSAAHAAALVVFVMFWSSSFASVNGLFKKSWRNFQQIFGTAQPRGKKRLECGFIWIQRK